MTNVLCESPTTERRRFSTEVARSVAQDFIDVLSDYCERIQIAGSLRRRKPFLKDVEIIFIPTRRALGCENKILRPDLFAERPAINLAERAIANLLEAGLITKRPNVNGVTAWGAKNKLAIHVRSE